MKKKLKTAGAIILIFILCINVGCSLFPDGTINDVEDGNGTISVTENESKHITGTLVGNVSIDADVDIPENIEWKQYKLVNRAISKEQADNHVKLFANGREYIEPDTSAYDPSKNRYYYEYSDGSKFIDGEDYVQYQTEESKKMSYHRFAGHDGRDINLWSDKAKAFPLNSLSECDLDKAIEQVRTLCGGLGIEINSKEPEIYVMDAESMNKLVEKSNSERGYEPDDEHALKGWKKENEVYYLIFEMTLAGAPMEGGSIETESKFSYPHWVTAAVGRDGIKEFNAEYLYTTAGEQALEGSPCTVDEAMKVVASQLQYMTENSNLQISMIELKYLGVTNTDLTDYCARPYWVFSTVNRKVVKKNGVDYEQINRQKIFIDAVQKITYIGK